MNLAQITAVAAAVADIIAKGNVLRGESIEDARPSLVWDPGDKERLIVSILRHVYGVDFDIDEVLSQIKEKYNE